MGRIVLASGSETRKRLLAAAGVDFDVTPSEIDEISIVGDLASATPKAVAALLAEAKARDVMRVTHDATVIGSDQTLDLAGDLMTKPATRTEAANHLARLSGQKHRLHASFAVMQGGRRVARATRTASLTMRRLDRAEIDWYLDRMGPAAYQSVGSYQFEGLGIRLFERVEGDFFTILGLPMIQLLAALRRLGAIAP